MKTASLQAIPTQFQWSHSPLAWESNNIDALSITAGAKTDLFIDPQNGHAIDNAPHNILLPLTSAVVHHGGAGTTAAGLRAGLPTLICPYSADQPFWRRRMCDIGVGPFSPNMKKLSADKLAGFLDDLLSNRSYREAAERAAQHIRSENGVEAAMDIIERVLS